MTTLALINRIIDQRREKYLRDSRQQATESRRRSSQTSKRHLTAPRPRPSACEVCGSKGGRNGIVFDHCHNSGLFRGWLCSGCNTALGAVRDSRETLLRLADYLVR
jgi:hypothetical protein